MFSSVTHVGSNPPILGFICRPTTVTRDTYTNIKETGFYTINHIQESNFKEGQYELVFFVDDYFKKITETPKIPFLDDVVIKFGISNAKEHYHIPLLVSPWSYSTYRGS